MVWLATWKQECLVSVLFIFMIYADCSKLRPWHHFNIFSFKNKTIILKTVIYFLITKFCQSHWSWVQLFAFPLVLNYFFFLWRKVLASQLLMVWASKTLSHIFYTKMLENIFTSCRIRKWSEKKKLEMSKMFKNVNTFLFWTNILHGCRVKILYSMPSQHSRPCNALQQMHQEGGQDLQASLRPVIPERPKLLLILPKSLHLTWNHLVLAPTFLSE